MYGGLTIAKSTYAHSGFTLYYQTREFVEIIALSLNKKANVTHQLREFLLLNQTPYTRLFYLPREILALKHKITPSSLVKLYKETLVMSHKFVAVQSRFFREILYLLDGKSRLPDLLAGVGSSLYASAMYAYSDLAPAYLHRFFIKISVFPKDTLTLGDNISFVHGFWRVYKEVVELGDKTKFRISKVIQEILVLKDKAHKSAQQRFLELLALKDTATPMMSRFFKETIALAERAILKPQAIFTEVIALKDNTAVTFRRLFREAIAMAERIKRKLNGFYLTWDSREDRPTAIWTRRDRADSDWTKRDRPTRFT